MSKFWSRHNVGLIITVQIAALAVLVFVHLVLNVRTHALQTEIIELSHANRTIDAVQNSLIAAHAAEQQYALTKSQKFLDSFSQNVKAFQQESSALKQSAAAFPQMSATTLDPVSLGEKWLTLYGTPKVEAIRKGSKKSTQFTLNEHKLITLFDQKIDNANSLCDARIVTIAKQQGILEGISFAIHILAMFLTGLIVIMLVLQHAKYRSKLFAYEKTQLVEHLAASMAHEIRNPLQVTRGFIQLIDEKITDEQTKQYVTYAITELDSAHHILSEYLALSKPAPSNSQLASLQASIDDVLQLLTAYGNEYGCQIRLLAHDIPDILVDAQKLKQILLNIGKNAIEAMGQGGELKLYLGSTSKQVAIKIEDSGPGMPKEQVSRLGQPFYTTKASGTGLGLMVAYRLADEIGGQINVHSVIEQGTTFEILLPKHSPHADPT